MKRPLDSTCLNQLFNDARSYNGWLDEPVSEAQLKEIWKLARMGPTSANCSPARVVFVVSKDSKARLMPHLMQGNVEKTAAAPATAIIGHDMKYYDRLPELFLHEDARSWFVGNQPLIAETAFRNGTLQAAYLMLAARALGLDCGAMSGFDKEAIDWEFFQGTDIKSNFLCNIGYGDAVSLFPRSPRLAFNDACKVI